MLISQQVCQHLRSAGLPKKTCARLANLTQKWVDKSGEEWAADRWKTLAQYAHQRLVNPSTPIPLGWASRSSKRGKAKILKDGDLHRYLEVGANNLSLTNLRYMEAICRIPSAILNHRPSLRRVTKSIRSIVEPFSGTSEELPMLDVDSFVNQYLIPTVGDEFGGIGHLRIRREEALPLRSSYPSDTRVSWYSSDPAKLGILQKGSANSAECLSPMYFFVDKRARSLYMKNMHEFSQLFTGGPGWFGNYMPYLTNSKLQGPLPIGRLALLNKDGSAKLRVIAVPDSGVQSCLTPLQYVLNGILKECPVSAVHDQESGKLKISEWLNKGRVCSGVDQSSFTDRFPYKLQRQLLVALKNRDFPITDLDIKILDMAVDSHWTIPQLGKASVKYSVGQPMGLAPSFPLATLTHMLVLWQAWRKDHSFPFNDIGRIVGDDIVICDEKVASNYIDLMVNTFGVTINESKSLTSDRFTEFCGKVITRTQEVPAVKYRKINDQAGLTEKLNFYGEKAQKFFSSEIKKFPKTLVPLPLGGGVKPYGVSYSEWIRPYSEEAAVKSIRDDISDFVGVSSGLKVALKRTIAWDKHYPSLMPLRISREYLSFAKEDEHRPSTVKRAPIFRDVVDSAMRKELDSHPGLPRDWRLYMNMYNYINQSHGPDESWSFTIPVKPSPTSSGMKISHLVVELFNKVMKERYGKSKSFLSSDTFTESLQRSGKVQEEDQETKVERPQTFTIT